MKRCLFLLVIFVLVTMFSSCTSTLSEKAIAQKLSTEQLMSGEIEILLTKQVNKIYYVLFTVDEKVGLATYHQWRNQFIRALLIPGVIGEQYIVLCLYKDSPQEYNLVLTGKNIVQATRADVVLDQFNGYTHEAIHQEILLPDQAVFLIIKLLDPSYIYGMTVESITFYDQNGLDVTPGMQQGNNE